MQAKEKDDKMTLKNRINKDCMTARRNENIPKSNMH